MLTPHTTVWLARHAETANPHVFHGEESDIELGEHGHRQAAAAADWFRRHEPHVVISSHMTRAKQTASAIATACGIPHVTAPSLHERRVGSLGGTSFALAEGPWVETVRNWTTGNTQFTTPGAESYADLVARLVPAFEAAVAPHAGKRVVLIAHGIVCKVLLLSLLPGHGPGKWEELGKAMNLSVSELTRAGEHGWSAASVLRLPEPVAAVDRARNV
jgi:broad specificity phosphatase PhoE